MGKHHTVVSEVEPQFIVQQSALAIGEENRVFKKLKPILAELRKEIELQGYILRNSTQAIIDLNNPMETAELALLATQLIDTSERLLRTSNQEQMKSVVLEGSILKALCIKIGSNQISIFMGKSINHERIIERFASIKA